MTTRIEWRRHLNAYQSVCDCGADDLHLRLSEAETWALTHEHEGETMTVTRPPAIADMLGVWDAQGPYPLRSTTEVASLVAWVKTLEQRIAGAAVHIDRARDINCDEAAMWSELVMALDVLNGEATA